LFLGIELVNFFICPLPHPLAPVTNGFSQSQAVGRSILENDFVERHRHRVEISRKGIRADAQHFKGDEARAAKGMHHQGWAIGMSGAHQAAGGVREGSVSGVFPGNKMADELYKRLH